MAHLGSQASRVGARLLEVDLQFHDALLAGDERVLGGLHFLTQPLPIVLDLVQLCLQLHTLSLTMSRVS